MKNWWVKLGCFFTGYNFNIVIRSSEVAAIKVKQTISALLIVCIIWGFVGYVFTQRYLGGSVFASIAGSLIACIIVIQIERQIILSIDPGKLLFVMRMIIALMMAIIGSVIIDQVIFKEDIEKRKISLLDKEVNNVFPRKSEELRLQIKSLDSTINVKEVERNNIEADLARNPTIKIYSGQSTPLTVPTTITDSARNTSTKVRIVNATSTSVSSMSNPKRELIKPLDVLISEIRNQKMKKDDALLSLRSSIESDIKSKVGFLDELNIMFAIIGDSRGAMFVWGIWFTILFGLELFIVASKFGEKENVYDATLKHQEAMQKRRLELLGVSGPDLHIQ